DIAGPDSDAQDDDVRKVLAEIGVGPDSGKRVVEVWNKIDLLDDEPRAAVMARAERTGAVAVSAVSGEGCEALLALLAALVDEGPDLVFDLAASDGEALAWLYRNGRVIAREDAADHVIIAARLGAQALGRFEQMRPTAQVRPAAE
ncbi:MAG: GTPase HflX, partial [Proteobacteria bacterium]|nr:GTPase HflX [Pseudomonadota bacterium]